MRRCRSTFYRPQRSFAKVMFLQVCVCPRGGLSIPACLAGGIPACLAAGLQGVCYPSMHCRWYPSMLCNRSPGGLFWGGVPVPRGVSAPGGAGIPACTEATPLPQGETATAADGTHPTGMHSCSVCFYYHPQRSCGKVMIVFVDRKLTGSRMKLVWI